MVVKNVCSAWALKQEVKYNQTPVNFSIRVSALSIWCSSALSQPIAGQFCIKTHKHDQRNPLPYKKKNPWSSIHSSKEATSESDHLAKLGSHKT